MNTKHLKRAGIGAALVTAAVIGGAALTSAQSGGAVIRACVGNGAVGNIRIPPDGKCTKLETAIEWNQQGLQGLPGEKGSDGAPGAQGEVGPQGEPGPAAPAGRVMGESHSIHALPHQSFAIVAACPTGTVATGRSLSMSVFTGTSTEIPASPQEAMATNINELVIGADRVQAVDEGSGTNDAWVMYGTNIGDATIIVNVEAICLT
jgi:hypothetical protein